MDGYEDATLGAAHSWDPRRTAAKVSFPAGTPIFLYDGGYPSALKECRARATSSYSTQQSAEGNP